MDVLSVGIVACDLPIRPITEDLFVADTTNVDPIIPVTGGDALNVAINLSNMGISVGICGRLGKDLFGQFIMQRLAYTDIDVSSLLFDDQHSTTLSAVLISPNGDRHFLYDAGATAHLSYEDVISHLTSDLKVLSIGSMFGLKGFSTESMCNLLKKAKAFNITTFVDVTGNPSPADLHSISTILPYVDYFIPSYEEASAMAKRTDISELLQFYSQLGAKSVIIKAGSKGAYGLVNGRKFHAQAIPVHVVDTTGAGDCFVAGMIAAYMKNYDFEASMCFACKAAGLSTTAIGATSVVQTFEEILR